MSTLTTEEHVQGPSQIPSQDKTIQLPHTLQSRYGNFVLSVPQSAIFAGQGFAVKLPEGFSLNPQLANDFKAATGDRFQLEVAPPDLRIGSAPVGALISVGIKLIAGRNHRTVIETPSLVEVVDVLIELLKQPGYTNNLNEQ